MSGNSWFASAMWDNGSADELFNNATLTCAARSIQDPVDLPYSTSLIITVKAILAIYYFITTLAGIILNTLVIVLVMKYKKLHTLSFLIAFQVVSLDLLRSVIFLFGIINIIANRWIFGEYMCVLTGILVVSLTQLRFLLMLVFVCNQYFTVFYPYRYPRHQAKVTILLIIVAWTVVIASGIAFVPGLLDCYAFGTFPSQWMCIRAIECSDQCSLVFRIQFGAIVLPSTTFPFFMYARLFYKAKKIQRELATHVSEGEAARQLRQRERKTTVTFFLLFLAVVVFSLPGALILIAISTVITQLGGELHPVLYILGVSCFASLSILTIVDPVVIMRNQDVREILTSLKHSAVERWHAHQQSRNQGRNQDHNQDRSHQDTRHQDPIALTHHVTAPSDLDQPGDIPVEVHGLPESPIETAILSIGAPVEIQPMEVLDSSPMEACDLPVESHDSPLEACFNPPRDHHWKRASIHRGITIGSIQFTK